QNWQSAFSWNMRRPKDTSWAQTGSPSIATTVVVTNKRRLSMCCGSVSETFLQALSCQSRLGGGAVERLNSNQRGDEAMVSLTEPQAWRSPRRGDDAGSGRCDAHAASQRLRARGVPPP